MNLPRIMAAARPDSPLRVTLFYVLFGTLWIVGTDWWVAWRMGEPFATLKIDMLKGLFFVLTTAGLLEHDLWVGDRLQIGEVIFAVTATGTPPLTYQWQRNGVAISGANGAGKSTLMKILAGIYSLDAGTYKEPVKIKETTTVDLILTRTNKEGVSQESAMI